MRDADIAEGVGGPGQEDFANGAALLAACLLYTYPSPRDRG